MIIHLFAKPRFQPPFSQVLCFSAKMIPDGTHVVSDVDRERDFVINYFLVDDSMSIYESPKRKAGLTGGRFLARGAAPKKPGTNKPYQVGS